jgi:hypothetical protein
VSAILGLVPLPLDPWVRVAVWASVVLGTVASWLVLRPGPDHLGGRGLLPLVILGVAARVLLFPADHILSDDAFRYHFDGKTVANLRNPFLHAPADPEVADLRVHALDARINRPHVVTVYPPTAQLMFLAGYLLSPGSLLGFRLVTLTAEILGWILLSRVASDRFRRGRRGWRESGRGLLLPVLFPLMVVQSYLPGHTEALAFPWLALALLGSERGWTIRTGVALGLATMVKPLPLLLLPAFLREHPRARWPILLLALGATLGVGLAPFVGAGTNLWSSMLLMARSWSFNGLLADMVGHLAPGAIERPLLAGLVVSGVAVATWRGRDLPARAIGSILALLAFSTTVYPWYVLWLVPFLAFRPDPTALALATLIPLVDLVVIDYYGMGTWDPAPWRTAVTWGGTFLVLGISVWRRWGIFAGDGSSASARVPGDEGEGR